jgi:glucose/mannose transport system permease protein
MLADVKTQFGIPAALIPIVIAACWQFAGFAMAMYLAGLGSIPEETREASRVDGASGWQTLRHITLPLLRPTTVSILVILGFTSLKIFDLVFVMSGAGPGFATDMPGVFIYEQMFGGLNYNSAAAAAVVMLVIIAAIAVPYLLRTYRKDEA